MAASGLISNLMIFIAVMMLTTGVIFSMNSFIDQTNNALESQKKDMLNNLNTDITIELANYDSEMIYIYIENTGKTSLKLDNIDLFIDKQRFDRGELNIQVLSDTEIKNPGIWDPKEEILIIANRGLESGDHTILVTTAYSGKDEYIFSN